MPYVSLQYQFLKQALLRLKQDPIGKLTPPNPPEPVGVDLQSIFLASKSESDTKTYFVNINNPKENVEWVGDVSIDLKEAMGQPFKESDTKIYTHPFQSSYNNKVLVIPTNYDVSTLSPSGKAIFKSLDDKGKIIRVDFITKPAIVQ